MIWDIVFYQIYIAFSQDNTFILTYICFMYFYILTFPVFSLKIISLYVYLRYFRYINCDMESVLVDPIMSFVLFISILQTINFTYIFFLHFCKYFSPLNLKLYPSFYVYFKIICFSLSECLVLCMSFIIIFIYLFYIYF